jgi:putative peptidoglycan lipid II flippase
MSAKSPQSALRGAAFLFIGRSLNRFLGLAREMLCASYFGTGWQMDCYNLAFTTVTSMRQLFAEQFLTPVLPVFFQRRKESGELSALLSLSSVTTRLNVIALSVCIVLFIFSRSFIHLIAPEFKAEQIHLATQTTRWFAVGGVAFILHRFYNGLHLCFFRYTSISFTPLLINVSAITAILFFATQYGVLSLAAGFSIGFLAFFLLNIYQLPHRAELLKPRWRKGDPGVAKFALMLGPLFIAVAAEQVQLYIDRSLASGLPQGALSAQGYALGIVRTSSEFWIATFGTVVFPVFSALAAQDKRDELRQNFNLAFQGVLLFLVMTGALMIALALPTIQVLLERGAFKSSDSLVTAHLLIYYTIAYMAQALNMVVIRAFHAFGDAKTPMIAILISIVVMIAADFLLIDSMVVAGLALALAIGYTLYLCITYGLF